MKGEMMQDLTNGRINTNNLNMAEWDLVKRAYDADWFRPTEDEWLTVRDLLGLFEILRGYAVEVDEEHNPYLQAGAAQIRLNEHGEAAWELYRDKTRYYQTGKPNTLDDFRPYMTADEINLLEWM